MIRTPETLAGRKIVRASLQADGTLVLTLGPCNADAPASIIAAQPKEDQAPLVVAVMRDPEGNGPGALHLMEAASGEFLGIVGGH